MIGLVLNVAKELFSASLKPYLDEAKDMAKDAAINTARDMVERVITGRRTIDKWAEIAITGVDKIKDRAISEDNLRFAGGKLKFAMSAKYPDKVVISFELYFLNENDEWIKIGAESDMYESNFTLEALEDIKSSSIVEFEVDD